MGNEWMALVVGIVTGSLATTAALFYYAVSYVRNRTISLTFENGAEHGDDSSACVRVAGHVLGERIEGVLNDDERAALGMVLFRVRDRRRQKENAGKMR